MCRSASGGQESDKSSPEIAIGIGHDGKAWSATGFGLGLAALRRDRIEARIISDGVEIIVGEHLDSVPPSATQRGLELIKRSIPSSGASIQTNPPELHGLSVVITEMRLCVHNQLPSRFVLTSGVQLKHLGREITELHEAKPIGRTGRDWCICHFVLRGFE
jgi:hypothetical protein